MRGDGPQSSDDVQVVVIGEAPGANEDRRGVPFIGDSGQILRTELNRHGLIHKTYITNLVKCRPPNNRTPTAAEIKACKPYLEEELSTLCPQVVVTAGVPATKTLFRGKAKINQFHGEIIENEKVSYTGFPVFHPAYCLRDPSKLPGFKDDIARLARLLEGGLRTDTVNWNVVRKGNLDQFIREFEEAPEFAFDCETSGLFPFDPNGYITAIAIALEERTWVIPGHMHPDYQRFSHSPFAHGNALKRLMQLLFFIARRDRKRTYGQNGKFDNKWMRIQFGGSFRLSFDTMLAHHLLDENLNHDLTSMVRAHLDDEPEYDVDLAIKNGRSEKPTLNYEYCAKDGAYTLRLGHILEGMLEQHPELHRLFWRLTMPGARAMEDIELEGLTIDPVARKEEGLKLLSKKITLNRELNELIGYEINWDAPKQVGDVLYEDLGLPCKIFTAKKQKSTSEAALYHLIGNEVVDKLLEYRTTAKLYNTYVVGWEKYRIGNTYYFDYKLHGTVTGRYSSPLHPIPRDGTIRNLVTALPGWTFLFADVSQAELRTAAHLSHDTEMMRCFNEGIDIHWRTCMNTMEVGTNEFSELVMPTCERLGADHVTHYSQGIETLLEVGPADCIDIESRWYDGRYRSKATNFGYIYGMREKKYVEQCKKDYGFEPSMAEAKQARAAYFALYAQLEAWHRKVKKLARLNGYVRTLTGRLRRLPGIQVRDRTVRAEAERQAVNSPVQGFIGDYKAMALVECHQTFERSKLRVVGEHHDALLIIVKDEHIDECVPKVLDIIRRPKLMDTFKIKLNVPMEGEAELGPWGRGTKYANG